MLWEATLSQRLGVSAAQQRRGQERTTEGSGTARTRSRWPGLSSSTDVSSTLTRELALAARVVTHGRPTLRRRGRPTGGGLAGAVTRPASLSQPPRPLFSTCHQRPRVDRLGWLLCVCVFVLRPHPRCGFRTCSVQYKSNFCDGDARAHVGRREVRLSLVLALSGSDCRVPWVASPGAWQLRRAQWLTEAYRGLQRLTETDRSRDLYTYKCA